GSSHLCAGAGASLPGEVDRQLQGLSAAAEAGQLQHRRGDEEAGGRFPRQVSSSCLSPRLRAGEGVTVSRTRCRAGDRPGPAPHLSGDDTMRTRTTLAAAAVLAAGALLGWLAPSGQLVSDVRARQKADPAVAVEQIDAVVAAEMKKQKVPGV